MPGAPSTRRREPPAVLPYALTFAPDGSIRGTFGGIATRGVYAGTATDGVFTLTVDGQALVLGTYECLGGECSLVGEELLGRPASFLISAPALAGTVRGSLAGLSPSPRAWVRRVAEWAQAHLDAARVGPVVASATRVSPVTAAAPLLGNADTEPRTP